jgi:hypothetical protein
MAKLDFADAFEFNKDNIVDAVSISLGSKRNRNNRMTVNYFDPSIGWQPNFSHLPPTEDAEFDDFLAEDNGVINETRIDLALTASEYHAKRIAYSILKLSRHQTVVSFKASFEALKLEVGQPVYLDYQTAGWGETDKKKFRVITLDLHPDGLVSVVLLEYAPDDVYIANHDYEGTATIDLGTETCANYS